jgi:hypothetical protein
MENKCLDCGSWNSYDKRCDKYAPTFYHSYCVWIAEKYGDLRGSLKNRNVYICDKCKYYIKNFCSDIDKEECDSYKNFEKQLLDPEFRNSTCIDCPNFNEHAKQCIYEYENINKYCLMRKITVNGISKIIITKCDCCEYHFLNYCHEKIICDNFIYHDTV